VPALPFSSFKFGDSNDLGGLTVLVCVLALRSWWYPGILESWRFVLINDPREAAPQHLSGALNPRQIA